MASFERSARARARIASDTATVNATIARRTRDARELIKNSGTTASERIAMLMKTPYPDRVRDIRLRLMKMIDSGKVADVATLLSYQQTKIGQEAFGTLNWTCAYNKGAEWGTSKHHRNQVTSTPLMACISSTMCKPVHKPLLLRLLLDAGADPNQRDDDGDTPLHIIANMPSLDTLQGDCIRVLRWFGADAELRDANGQVALYITITNLDGPSAALIASGAEFFVDPIPMDAPRTATEQLAEQKWVQRWASRTGDSSSNSEQKNNTRNLSGWNAFVDRVTKSMSQMTPDQLKWARQLQHAAMQRWQATSPLIHDVVPIREMVGMVMVYLGAPFDAASIPRSLAITLQGVVDEPPHAYWFPPTIRASLATTSTDPETLAAAAPGGPTAETISDYGKDMAMYIALKR